ncbi:hypothetical protein GCM10027160_12040 [Streptomyces calidiresistens]|uniref:Uncharacterized protein n=1 Tax=Streptomyces calidiresistens TaxID=1485586 RepID=A0A7W3T1K6_9ACTN|nr:hypothetical protein [Streptomyces calidiresistens]MBB0229259.1 hypothetical protein [Streptomyces calidiresistens]
MAGRSEPPEGTPTGFSGEDEEWRSTVFDESFIRAARIEEFSAQRRLEEETSPVRNRFAPAPESRWGSGLPAQGIVLGLIVLTALAVAVLLGTNSPYNGAIEHTSPPWTVVVPLVPGEEVPGGTVDELTAEGPVADLGVGAAGLELPEARRTEEFGREQVAQALALAKEYAVAATLTPEVLTGATVLPVRGLLRPEQQRQLDRSLAGGEEGPVATGWLIRFDPSVAALADPRVRTGGTFTVREVGAGRALEVSVALVAAYAVRPAEADVDDPASLFMVQRRLRMEFTERDLRERRVVLVGSQVAAGPADCAVDPSRELRPLFAGERPSGDAPEGGGTDPFSVLEPSAAGGTVCGTLRQTPSDGPAGS